MKNDTNQVPFGADSTSLFPEKSHPAEVPIRSISLWQPHASAIALGLKPYETRSWSTKYRGTIVICSSKKRFRHQDYPTGYYQEVCKRLSDGGCPHFALRYGEAMCLVDLVDCIPTDALRGRIGRNAEFWGNFSQGRFAFKMENVRPVFPSVKVVGRQGWFSVNMPFANDCFRMVK